VNFQATMTFKFGAVLAAIMACSLVTSAADNSTDFSIRFAAGEMVPPATVPRSVSELSGHFIIQFDHALVDAEKSVLLRGGVHLLEYLPDFAYLAVRVPATEELDLSRAGIRWTGKLTAEQKLSPAFLGGDIPEWARRDGDSIQITVAIQKDIDARSWASSTVGRVLGAQTISNAAELVVPVSQLANIARQDEVIYVQPCLPFPVEHNDGCRSAAKVDSVQAAPYSLSGSGIMLGMWDGGRADSTHPDLTPRILAGDTSAVTSHATHVAGTLLGTGSQSGGTYKGVAPSATLVSRLWWNTSSEAVTQYTDLISNYSIEIANNSWGVGVPSPATNSACVATLGNYFIEDETIDNIVRGDAGAPITVVWSAGNQRSTSPQYCGSIGWTYNTIDPLASSKNVIAVGAVISNDNSMSTFSSWGPTDDGRIKPDICAPGCQIGGDNGVTSTKPTTGYAVQCGTSMAAPMVSGVIALMRQRWNQLVPSDNLFPATIKGILINSADEKGTIGPDYQYGHGVLNSVAAVRKVSVGAGSYVEAAIITGVTHDYNVSVPSGATKLRATLVWDDPGGTALSGNALINDLDLSLVDPGSSVTLPWILSPGNPGAAATKGVDRKNNVETVEASSPASGIWHVKVTGYNIPEGPQNYSIVFSPDSSNTTDTARAVDARSAWDTSALPNASAPVRFVARNWGGGYDSIRIRITDSLGWLAANVDTVVWLAPFDSSVINRTVTVPNGTAAGTLTKVLCLATSQSDTLTRDSSTAVVSAQVLYQLSAVAPSNDTSASPEQLAGSVWVTNTGNVPNLITVNMTCDSGWSITPGSVDTQLVAGDSALITCTLHIPAEVPDGAISTLSFLVSGEQASSTSALTTILTNNPFPPPHLRLPDTTVYFTNRAPEFVWSAQGTGYRLVIASDTQLLSPVRTYAALTDTAFDMPTSDSLIDGLYYWGVKAFSATESSSYQRLPRTLYIDNLPPVDVVPVYPLPSSYPPLEHFDFLLALGVPGNPVVAPEYNVIELSQDSLFVAASIYQPVVDTAFVMPDEITEGRWFWRAKRADSAGNTTGFSPPVSFVLDTTAPPTPGNLRPQDTATVGAHLNVVFDWNASPTFSHASSPDYYRAQISTQADFSTTVLDTLVFADSVAVDIARFSFGDTLFWKVQALDSAGWGSLESQAREFRIASYICADMDSSGNPDIADVTVLIAYLYLGGPPPYPPGTGSVDCEEGIDIADLTTLIAYLYLDGPPPCCF
jgi:hypothetical protein